MKESEESATFYKMFFSDELYKIKEKSHYAENENQQSGVLEQEAPYQSSQNYFEGITSNTLILFSYPDSTKMSPGDKVLLGQVLKAVGLSFETVSRLNTSNLPLNTSWEQIAAQSGSDFVIAFGVDKKYVPLGIGEGQIYNINNKRVLYTATLSELIENNMRKKMLWQGLKEIYGI